ncbi:MAG: hypothetical protein BWX74_00316 [Tenericutes bacterium ADurb.Bin087]|nr:MAG: hypothetical protein BWX74_00316 [Tenericutes bacterium ADurb.Bin087]
MQKNNFKNRFLTFFATLAMAVGIGVSLNVKAPVKAAAAAVKLYLKVSDEWKSDGARFETWFFEGSAPDLFVSMERTLYADNLYEVIKPAGGHQKFIMVRMNPAKPEHEWTSVWNQSGDLVYDATKELVRVTGWNAGEPEAFDPSEHINPAIWGETVLYLRPDASYFAEGYDHLAAYFFVGDENQFVNLVEHKDGVYKVTAPTPAAPYGWEKVIFVSLKSAANAWEVSGVSNVLKQTADLVFDGTNDMYDTNLSAWKTLGSLISQTPTTAGINNDKVRIWVNRDGHYATTDYQYLLKAGDVHYTATGYEKALFTGDVHFVYFDVPLSAVNGKNVDLVIVDTGLYFQVAVAGGVYAAKDNSKLWTVTESGGTFAVAKGAVSGRVYNTFVGKVLEGYLTCSTSNDNGHGAFPTMKANLIPWVTETEMNVEGQLSDVNITDYTGEGTAGYGDIANRTATVDAWAKYLALEALGGGIPSGQNRTNEFANVNIINLLAIGMLFTIAALGFVRFRKKANLA